MGTITSNDRKLIIWNFMEELCEKDQKAMKKNLPTDFNLNNFYNMNIFRGYFLGTVSSDRDSAYGQDIVLDILREYAESKRFFRIKGENIRLTKKGLLETQKLVRDWD